MTAIFDIPTLHTPRLTLRAFRADDWDALAAMSADMAVMRFLGGRARTREEVWASMESALGQWALRGYGLFAVEADGVFAGRVGILHPADWPEPELAWTIASPFWGKGFATEAAQAVRDQAFGGYGFARLVSYILPENVRSQRVAAKLGAAREGTIALRGFEAEVWAQARPG